MVLYFEHEVSFEKEKRLAVSVDNVSFGYKKSNLILNNINVNVGYGKIYALLGSSGCGKTTLLKCVLGQIRPISGDIKVFGAKPASNINNVPGCNVGYMPQQLSLYMNFTQKEIFNYFGKLFAMSNTQIKERMKFLLDFLKLPNDNKIIDKFSGGQQRRISLALTLLHSPPLLILDEPTVGLDSILRKNVWDYLVELCKKQCYTVIITTHYIEEAISSNYVGFMRNGQLLAEDNPNNLIHNYKAKSLDEVFLQLSYQQELNNNNNNNHNKDVNNGFIKNNLSKCVENQNENVLINGFNHRNKSTFKTRIMALLMKNYYKIRKSFMILLILIFLPTVGNLIAIICLGNHPVNQSISVYNQEGPNGLGQLFINTLNKSYEIKYFNKFQDAYDNVKKGDSKACIFIKRRFSSAFKLRIMYGEEADKQIITESMIRIYVDYSNQIVAGFVKRDIYANIMTFYNVVTTELKVNPEFLRLPLQFEEPVYGIDKIELFIYGIPGFFIVLAFFGSSFSIITIINDERQCGMIHRSIIAGISIFEFILSYVVFLLFIILIQLSLLLLLIFKILNFPIFGSLFLLALLYISVSISGISFGILISAFFKDNFQSCIAIFATLVPSFLVSGWIWPIQNMPVWIKNIVIVTPTTISVESLRNILYRGWDITYFHVYIGFVVTHTWSIIFFALSFYFLKKSN